MARDLFDRELETQKITRMLGPHVPRTIAMIGNSGVGKSVLIEKCLQQAGLQALRFSFKPESIGSSPSLASFLVKLNDEYNPSLIEKYTHLKLKDIKLGIPKIGSITFDILPEAIDGNYCEYIFGHLVRAGYKAFRIENIELCRDSTDVAALNVLSGLSHPHLKLVFEIGTLDEIDPRLRHIQERRGHREVFELKRLNEDKTLGLHRFLHGNEPPPDLFRQTGGLPLAVEHHASIAPTDRGIQWVGEKLQKLDRDCWKLAYILSNLDEPCPAQNLERIYAASDFYSVLLTLIKENIFDEDDVGVRFKHPSFRLALRRRPSPSLDQHILSKTLEYREAVSDGSTEFLISIVSVARKLGDRTAVTVHGLNGLTKAYKTQNALELLYLCDALLEAGALVDRQRRIVQMVEIQALNQLMRPDDAKAKLNRVSELWPDDTRVAVLRAMTLCQQNQKDASNQLIDRFLAELDPRSAAIALAIRIANDIPSESQERSQIQVFFEDALAMTRAWGLADIEEELVRLNAKLVSPPELAIERMRDHLTKPPSTEVSRARLIHNLGVQEMLVSDARDGVERLWEARDVFTRHGLSFAAYSAVSLAVAEMARGGIDKAMAVLLDAQCLCREQYDLFGVLNNLACCFLIADHADKALSTLEQAATVLTKSPAPLEDKILESCLHQNIALTHLKLKNFEAAETEIGKVKLPCLAHRIKERQTRLRSISDSISRRDNMIALENSIYDKSAWLYTRFVPNFMTLSFYDYPFSVIAEDELASLQSTRH